MVLGLMGRAGTVKSLYQQITLSNEAPIYPSVQMNVSFGLKAAFGEST
jgi:hypothetical protein